MTRVTDQSSYRRRRFIAGALGLGAFGAFSALRYGDSVSVANETDQDLTAKNDGDILLFEDTGARLTTKHAATHYNNAYEFGWDKTDPYQKSGAFELKPWQVTFDGLCAKPGTFDLDDLMGMPFSHLEERVYDFRCVEAWSMAIPYTGRPLRDILQVVEPLGAYNSETLAIEGVLADAWQFDPDGMWLRVHLNPRAAFSDGTPVTSEERAAADERFGHLDQEGLRGQPMQPPTPITPATPAEETAGDATVARIARWRSRVSRR